MVATRESPTGHTWELHRLGRYEVATTTEFGPRITGLWVNGSENLFAVLGPEVRIENPYVGDYLFQGGHRLWVAPEAPETTHLPDGKVCLVTSTDGSLEVAAQQDRAGFSKTITVQPDNDRLIVNHQLTWSGEEPKAASPWAITQLPPGGTAILPLPSPHPADEAFQADRALVLWPYTRLDDPRLEWRDRAVLMKAAAGPQLKLGAGPKARQLGYLGDGLLFSKWSPSTPGSSYPDLGATAQIFLHERFCELETLGPIEVIEPGSSLIHRETWKVSECPSIDAALGILLEEQAE